MYHGVGSLSHRINEHCTLDLVATYETQSALHRFFDAFNHFEGARQFVNTKGHFVPGSKKMEEDPHSIHTVASCTFDPCVRFGPRYSIRTQRTLDSTGCDDLHRGFLVHNPTNVQVLLQGLFVCINPLHLVSAVFHGLTIFPLCLDIGIEY
jgi:hypothetical protein